MAAVNNAELGPNVGGVVATLPGMSDGGPVDDACKSSDCDLFEENEVHSRPEEPYVGARFETLLDAKNHYNAYALRSGFYQK